MKKIIFTTFILVLLLINFNSLAQVPGWSWSESTGNINMETCSSISLDDSGNVYSTGLFEDTVDFDPGPGVYNLISNGNQDIFISKYSSGGNFIWAKAFGGPNYDRGLSIKIDHQQNILVTGYFSDTIDFDPGVNTHYLHSAGLTDIFILKMDVNGNYIWSVNMGGADSDAGGAIAVDDSNNVYTTGSYNGTADFDPDSLVSYPLTSHGELEIFVSKLDNTGKFAWAKTIGGIEDDQGYSIDIDPWGNVLVTGYFELTADFDPGQVTFALTSGNLPDAFILKLDRNGNFDWAKSFTGITDNDGTSIVTDQSGNIYSTGYYIGAIDYDPDAMSNYVLTSAGNYDAYISKLDSAGNFVWAKSIGGTNDDQAFSITLDDSANVYLAGIFSSTTDLDPDTGVFNLTAVGGFDFFIEKVDSSGNFNWGIGEGGNNRDQVNSIALDQVGNIYAGGYFYSKTLPLASNVLTNADTLSINPDFFVGRLGNHTTGIKNISDQNRILVYPNPGSGDIKIKLPMQLKEVNICLYDLSGKKNFSSNFFNSKEIEINKYDLVPGIYFLKINSDDFIDTEKIIITN